MTYSFLERPPKYIEEWIFESSQPVNDKLRFVVETTSSYKKSGIYSAERDDTTKPVVIDWGDGTVEQVDGDVSQKVHEYSSIGTFDVVAENVKSYYASVSYSWTTTTSQNLYTLKAVVSMPGHMTSIGDFAFYNCQSLSGVNIHRGITHIGNYAFSNCGSLMGVEFPPSVSGIGERAFAYCHNLVSSKINAGVTRISASAFRECTRLPEITIPSSVTYIGGSAFRNMNSLSSITFEGKTKSYVQTMLYYDWDMALGNEYVQPYPNTSVPVTVNCSDGSFQVQWTIECFPRGTKIRMADGTTKNVEDVDYGDSLAVWDFDGGQLSSAQVCWLTLQGLRNNHYYQLTFDDGTVLRTTGQNSNHKIYDVDKLKFEGVRDVQVGDRIYSIGGIVTVADKKYIEGEVEYYNLMTSGTINCFAEGILASNRYSNIYPIDGNMKYVKEDRQIRPYSEFEQVGIDRYFYDNLRLGEIDPAQEPISKTAEYIRKITGVMRPLPES